MTVKSIIQASLSLSCLAVMFTSFAGCIREDRDDCEQDFSFKVVAHDPENEQNYSDEVVSSVTLYVFDTDLRFLNQVDAQIGETVVVKVPKGNDVNVVAWGNLNGNEHKLQPLPGELKEELYISLMQQNSRALNYCLSPDDLFIGEKRVANEDRQGEKIVDIYRAVGSMTIKLRGIKEYLGDEHEANYSVVVRQTRSAIDFNGRYIGEKTAAYRPTGTFATYNGRSELTIPAFNMIPEEEGLYIEIYHKDGLVATFPTETIDKQIVVERGKLTNILIDFGYSIRISITDWGKYELWKDF